MTSLRLRSLAGMAVEPALASVVAATLARRREGAFAEVAPEAADTLIRALAYVGIAAEPCVVDLAPPAGTHPAIARDLTPLTDIPPVLDLVDVRRLTLGVATDEALARRWRRVRGPSRSQWERCRSLLRGEEVAFAWRRRAWTTRAAFRAPLSRRVLRPVVFDRDAFASLSYQGRVLASDRLIGRWLF